MKAGSAKINRTVWPIWLCFGFGLLVVDISAQDRQPDRLYREGVARQQSGDDAGAIELLRQAIAARPNQAAAHSALGYSLGRRGDLAGAISELRTATQIGRAHV